MEELKEILQEVMKITKFLGLNCSPDMILDCSTRIFNSNSFNSQDKVSYKGINNEEQPATDAQLAYLEKLGAENIDGLTKNEATTMIQELKRKKR